MRNYCKLYFALFLLAILSYTGARASATDTKSVKSKKEKSSVNRPEQSAVGSDPLDWLGPLPKVVNEKVTSEAFDRVFKRMETMMESDLREEPNLREFVCRTPAEVGPVPLQKIMEKFVAEWPGSRYNSTSLSALFTAAREGNWLARSWLFTYMLEYTTDPILDYRRMQLLHILLDDKVGVIYSFASRLFGGSGSGGMGGNSPDIFEIHAALHNSYSAQYKVGKYLIGSKVPAEANAGKRMVSCAMNAVPGYVGLLEKEKNSLNMMTF